MCVLKNILCAAAISCAHKQKSAKSKKPQPVKVAVFEEREWRE